MTAANEATVRSGGGTDSPGLWEMSEASLGYDSFPALPGNASPKTVSEPRRAASGGIGLFSAMSSMFGGTRVESVELAAPEEAAGGDDMPVFAGDVEATQNMNTSTGGVYFSAEEDNIIVEGFMCPICMIDCGGATELMHHFETSHSDPPVADGSLAAGSPAPTPTADEVMSVSEADLISTSPANDTAAAPATDATSAWANAVPALTVVGSETPDRMVSPERQKGQRMQHSNRPSPLPSPAPGPVSSSSTTASAFDKMPGGRNMYCERCFVHKMHIEDAYCLNCGQPHTNRMQSVIVNLKLRVSSFGFGLGFKDHYVHKVQPGSTSEVSGLRVGDTITAVNGIPVKDKTDMVR